MYEKFGIVSYWIVEPDAAKPELTVFELRDGRYQEAARITGTSPSPRRCRSR